MLEGHCQICDRLIKMKRGVIAHHGYMRPGQGWQTPSCLGARHLPYEQSRDRIRYAIDVVLKPWLDRARLAHKKWMTDPPAEIRIPKRHFGGLKIAGDDHVYTRPSGFTPPAAVGSWTPRTYEGEHMAQRVADERQIKQLRADIVALEARYDAWKRPVNHR